MLRREISGGGYYVLRSQRSTKHSQRSKTRSAHGHVRKIRKRNGRPRPCALERRSRQTRLRQRFKRGVEDVDRAFQNAHERVPLKSSRPEFHESYGRTNGTIFLRRRSQAPRRLCSSKSKRLRFFRPAAIFLWPHY